MKKYMGHQVNELSGEEIFIDNEIVFKFTPDEYIFDYIESLDEEIDNLHACIITFDNKKFYCGTDGISEKLFGRYWYDDDNLYIAKESFNTYFTELPYCPENLEFEEIYYNHKNSILVAVYKDEKENEYEAKAIFDYDYGYRFVFENDYLNRQFDWLNTVEMRDNILKYAIDEDYNAYQLVTRGFTKGNILIEVENAKGEKVRILLKDVNIDNTGNGHFGGFYFEEIEEL